MTNGDGSRPKQILDPLDRSSEVLRSVEKNRLHSRIRAVQAADAKDAGLAVCILVFLSTFPVALPFLLFRDLFLAARVSDATALAIRLGG